MSSTNGLGNNHSEVSQLARTCHVIKRDDFDGYGFNLHAEKGKPGQYIGKVDEQSPAESSGLRQGDRIIEVNGVNIGNETHKQVVQRIKAIANEVRLLVVDPAVVSVSTDNVIVNATTNGDQSSSKASTPSNENLNDEPSSISSNGDLPQTPSTDAPDAVTTNGVNSKTSQNAVPPPPSQTQHQHHQQQQPQPDQPPQLPQPPQPQQASQQQQPEKSPSNNEGLNLKMTAAELRAKLAAKKKYDPKSDTDLRKKYDIVQKL